MPGKDASDVKAAFRQVVAKASRCVVRVKCDGRDAVLGTIVGPDGWILTKASELKGRIVCRTKDGTERDATVVGVSRPFDLAMLKVDAGGLPSIDWKRKRDKAVGRWVATPGLAEDPLALGVVSVPRRKIPPPSGVLGVIIDDAEKGTRVTKILPKSPAEKAGLKVDDVITHVNGKPTRS